MESTLAENLNNILTVLLGSDRSGWDLFLIIGALAVAGVLITGRKKLVDMAVGLVEARVRVWEAQASWTDRHERLVEQHEEIKDTIVGSKHVVLERLRGIERCIGCDQHDEEDTSDGC